MLLEFKKYIIITFIVALRESVCGVAYLNNTTLYILGTLCITYICML